MTRDSRPRSRGLLILGAIPITLIAVIGLVVLRGTWTGSDTQWQTVASLPEPRSNHGVVVLEDGSVLIAGGERGSDPMPPVLSSSALFDPESGTWSQVGELNVARQGAPLTRLTTGEVLIAGGAVPGESHHVATSVSEIFHPIGRTWSRTGELNVPRYRAAVARLDDGRVLIVAGSNGPPDGERFQASAEIYEPREGRWRVLEGELAVARDTHFAVTLDDGRVLVGGGEGPWNVTSRVSELFDPATETFVAAGNMNTPRRFPSVTKLSDGRVLVAGGWDVPQDQAERVYYSAAEVYDPANGAWQPVAEMARPRAFHVAALLPDGRVLVAGGQDSEGYVTEAEVYDPTSDSWTSVGPLPVPVRSITSTAAVVPGLGVLVVGGVGAEPGPAGLRMTASVQLFPLDAR